MRSTADAAVGDEAVAVDAGGNRSFQFCRPSTAAAAAAAAFAFSFASLSSPEVQYRGILEQIVLN